MSSNEVLLNNVRSAVGTELTTLPLYLYPYWSIRPANDGGSDAGQAATRSAGMGYSGRPVSARGNRHRHDARNRAADL